MKRFVLNWVVLAVSVVAAALLTSMVIPGGFAVELKGFGDVVSLFVATGLLAMLNATLGKLLKLIAIPLNCLTLGLFSLVINAAMLMVVGSLGLGLTVKGFVPAFLGSILISAVSAALGAFVKDKKDD
ncbi:MAG: phage holin family protein [Fimbriimonadaceae bacterium]|nr:phage holin family protein [Fimbriimonadaceae bacterium]